MSGTVGRSLLRGVAAIGAGVGVSANAPFLHQNQRASASCEQRKDAQIKSLGYVGVDYIAEVEKYPKPDDKIRTVQLQVHGGGNTGNTITAISRLGVPTAIISKVGADANGKLILDGLKKDKIDVENIIVDQQSASGFVYVVVDRENASRTCIATLPPEITIAQLQGELLKGNVLAGTEILHLDSRHTQAAVPLADLANQRNILVSLDAEKDRPPFLAQLIPKCDIIFTNERFAALYLDQQPSRTLSSERNFSSHDAYFERWRDRLLDMAELYSHSTRLKLIVSTLGKDGSLMLMPSTKYAQDAVFGKNKRRENDSLHYTLCKHCPVSVKHSVISVNGKQYEAIWCPAFPIKSGDIKDTTGAGDAYIGGFLAGIVKGYDKDTCMILGTATAVEKLRKYGARDGLPTANALSNVLESKS